MTKTQNFLLRLVKILFVLGACFTPTFAEDDVPRWLENLVPKNYSKHERPTSQLWENDAKKETVINVEITKGDFINIDSTKRVFTVEMKIKTSWIDERLIISDDMKDQIETHDKIEIPKVLALKLWIPQLHLANCMQCNEHLTDPKLHTFELSESSLISVTYKKMITLQCKLDLHKYPFDAQHLKIRIKKSDNRTEVPFTNLTEKSISTKNVDVDQEFRLIGVKWLNCTGRPANRAEENVTDDSECIEYVLHIRRKATYHVMLTFIPATIIVIASWISFWLDANIVPPRITLGLTSLLTLTMQISRAQELTPDNSSVKAIDVWMFTCILMVFSSLMEFAVAHYLISQRKCVKNLDVEAPIKSIIKGPESKDLKRHFIAKMNVASKIIAQTLLAGPSPLDYASRIVFPVIFIIFNIIFWVYYTATD